MVITTAITGSIHTPTMSPHLPVTPEQIADEAVMAAEAGAAIVHIHVRNPTDGKPSTGLSLYREVLQSVKSRSDVVVNITTGAALGATLEQRVLVVPTFRPELASFNMGSMNFALYHVSARIKEWKYDWEKSYLDSTRDFVFRNTFADMEFICKTMYEHGTKPELECYDVGHIYNAKRLISDGVLKTPIHMQFVMGITGGIGTRTEDLLHMQHTADEVIGRSNYTWSVAAAGRFQFPLCVSAAIIGGHVRVGLEDNLYLSKGVLAKSNAELVSKIRRLVLDVTGREAATPDEARNILGLKGKESVSF